MFKWRRGAPEGVLAQACDGLLIEHAVLRRRQRHVVHHRPHTLRLPQQSHQHVKWEMCRCEKGVGGGLLHVGSRDDGTYHFTLGGPAGREGDALAISLLVGQLLRGRQVAHALEIDQATHRLAYPIQSPCTHPRGEFQPRGLWRRTIAPNSALGLAEASRVSMVHVCNEIHAINIV